MDSSPQPRSRFLLAAAIAWMVVVFVADLLTPLGVSVWALYVPAILVAAPLGRPKVIVLLASACSALTIAGFFLSPPGGAPGWGVANRAMGLLALWLSAWAAVAITSRSRQVSETLAQLQREVASRQQSEAQLRELTGQLEQRVTERTRDLEEKQRRVEAIVQAAVAPQAETVAQLRDELFTAMKQARDLSHELYAVPPQPDGLMQALDNLAERVSTGHGVASEFASDTVLVHDPTVASHLYRIVQEAVHNALKHSRATRIWIELIQQPDGLELRVRDNGIGFSTHQDSHASVCAQWSNAPD